MKFHLMFLTLCFGLFFFMSCDEPPQKTNEKIDSTAEGLKDLIDVFSEKSKDIVNDKELQNKLKDVLKDLETEGMGLVQQLESIINEREGDWKQKIEDIKNDPKFKEQIDELKKDGKGIEDILSDISEALNDQKVEDNK